MTAVSQMIPTYAIGGISNQPDELKKPGQVRDCVNGFPDLIEGLYKRNGFQFVGNLQSSCSGQENAVGSWFTFVRENPTTKNVENFVGKVSLNGSVFVWNSDTGQEAPVYYSSEAIDPSDAENINAGSLSTCGNVSYLNHNTLEALRFNSINDYTFIANPGVAVTMGGALPVRPYEAFVEITQLAPGREYILNVDIIDSGDTTEYNRVKRVAITGTNNFSDNSECSGTYREPEYELDETYLTTVGGPENSARDLILDIESIGQQVPFDSGNDVIDYECKYRHTVDVVNGGRGWNVGDVINCAQDGSPTSGSGNPGYQIEVTEVTRITTPVEYVVTGVITSNTGDTVLRVLDVLTEMRDKLIAEAGFSESQVQIIGNGLYLTRNEPFTISTSEKDLMNLLSNEDQARENPVVTVNNASRLPLECKDGLIAKVSNSFAGEDDYWVEFKSNYSQDGSASIANGYWQECPRPNTQVNINPGTMPHALVYSRSGAQTVFVLGPVKWNDRTCGNGKLNPSFWKFNINHVSFFRNRLVMLSQENVIMSRAGDLFNFFPTSALAVSPQDPIDISASTDYSAVLQDALIINNGLVIFSNYQQFLLTTDSDILDPSTAKITEIGRYEYNTKSQPFAIGTNIGFLGTSSQYSKLYEMSGIFREGSVDINERSEIIAKSLPSDLSLIAQSKETGLIMLGKRDSADIWCYRYFKPGANQELQSTWFRWVAPYPLEHQFILNDTYYAVLDKPGTGPILTKVELETMAGPYIDLGDIPYEMKVEFPTIQVTRREQTTYAADTTASLVVHRVIFNLADIGSYYIKLDRFGMDDYNILYESRYMDDYKDDQFPTFPKVERSIPVYTRNELLDITLTSSFTHPLILRSMRWEGDYNQRYYKRV